MTTQISRSSPFREAAIATADTAARFAPAARRGRWRRAAEATLNRVMARVKAGTRRQVAATAAVAGLVVPLAAALPATAPARASTAQPDTVTQWNLTMIAGLEAAAIPPPPSARIGAIVQASVFDAVNGITRRYASYHMAPAAPPGASRAAAVAGAAYAALVA